MKNPEVLTDMPDTEETMMIFSNIMDLESILKSEKSGDLLINPEKWSTCINNMVCQNT